LNCGAKTKRERHSSQRGPPPEIRLEFRTNHIKQTSLKIAYENGG